ncbi:MAG: hypothetical protein NTY53_24295 [Kiritimatiellaeota bacterium]|nr:hypothetical protein [Kiritimatiellota bacterium]
MFRLGLGGWGPNWQWVGIGALTKATGERLTVAAPFVVNKAKGEVINVKFEAWQSGPRQISFKYDLSAAQDVPVTMVIASLGAEKAFAHGQWTLTHTDGKTSTIKLPIGITGRPATTKAVLHLEKAGEVEVGIDPPCAIAFDGDMRVVLADKVFKAGTKSTTLTLTFPTEATFLAKQADLDGLTKTLAGPDWFAFAPANEFGPSVIGMEDWLDKPAGKHGGVRIVGDRFEFEDKTPVKFWGVNLSYGSGCAPKKEDAEFTAARYAKYGINGVRLHKFTYPKNHMGIGENNDATVMMPEGLDRLDYFAAQLKQRGIYFGWSHTFGFQVCPGNRSRLVAYDGRQSAQAQESAHGPDLRRRAGARLHRTAKRGRHLLLHVGEGVQRVPDLQETFHRPVRRLAQGEIRLRRWPEKSMGRCAQVWRNSDGKEYRTADESVVLRRRPSASAEGRRASTTAGLRRMAARVPGQILHAVREGDPRDRLPRPALRLAMAGADDAAALSQPALRRACRLH